MRSVLVLHGPSLSRLGRREPEIYGTTTLAELDARLVREGASLGFAVVCHQSNHEGVLIDRILAAEADGHDGVLLNAGAFAHTSLALADAVRAVAPLPVLEIHLSNTVARGPERHAAVVGAACRGRIEGFGVLSYVAGLRVLADLLDGR